MELDLLGLGLPPPATAGHGDSAAQRHDPEKAGSDEPPRLAAATAETPPPARARARRCPVDTEDHDVPAPPASRRPKLLLMAAPTPQVRVPGATGDQSPRASQLGFFRGMFPSAPGDLAAAAAGHAQLHAMATITTPPPLLGVVSAPAANGFGRPPPFAAWPIFEGSPAAPSSNQDHSTAPLTIIYAGSVRAFDSVPVEQAEKILCSMTAKEAQATETPAFQMPQPAAAQQMMMLLGLANANDSLLPKRTASLARFLHKRKQRVERAAAMPYPCEEVLQVPVQAPSRDIEQPWGASEDGPKSMKENHGEEAVNTDLKM